MRRSAKNLVDVEHRKEQDQQQNEQSRAANNQVHLVTPALKLALVAVLAAHSLILLRPDAGLFFADFTSVVHASSIGEIDADANWTPIEPELFPGLIDGAPIARLVTAINVVTGEYQSIEIPNERIFGNYRAWLFWPHRESPTLLDLTGTTEAELLAMLGVCDGDANHDGRVDIGDINLVLARFSEECD